jgi:hypothetical protein
MWYSLELIIIVVVILYQIILSIKILSNINKLSDIFTNPLKVKFGLIEKKSLYQKEDPLEKIVFLDDDAESSSVEEVVDQNVIKISITETLGKNEIITRIKNAINNYLLNNYGAAVNFSIIKDMIDREVDVKDEEISQTIPSPLYLGLAATMIGIIFGLLSMPKIDGSDFSIGIHSLIDGVKLAMSGSLMGLICTTVLSSFFYKKAKKKTLEEKNEQLSYLQAKLLPELIKAEDTGVSGLKASLDRFAREATKIADNVNNAAIHTGLNIAAQQEIITKIERINVLKVSRVNLELFDRLETNMAAFNNFSEFLSVMEKISSNLKDFALKTTNIDSISKQILSTVQESKQLTQFLTSHFEKIEAAGSTAVSAISLSDSHFRKAIDILDSNLNEALERLNTEIQERITSMSKLSDNAESTLKESYEEITKQLNLITSHHLDEFKSAFSNAVPKFEKLDELVNIKTAIEISNQHSIENSNRNNQVLIESINNLNSAIQIKSSILTTEDHQKVKHDKTIEQKIKDFSLDEQKEEKSPIGIIGIWKQLFKKLKNG